MTDDAARDHPPLDSEGPPKGGWDFALMMLTVTLLGGLGVQSLVGTGYVWWAERTFPDWQQTSYSGFVATMNAIAAPMALGIAIALGLCVPKRLFRRRVLVAVSAAMPAAGAAAWVVSGDALLGLGVYLELACILQAAVVVMTLADAGSLTYMTEGRVTKAGSGALHLGVLLFALAVTALRETHWLMPAFWASTVLLLAGSAASFYARRIAERLRR